MKIAHLTTVDMSLRYLLMPQLEAAAKIGEVIGISAPGEHVEGLRLHGVRHIPLEASTRGVAPLNDVRAAFQLWRILRRERVDVLHTHNPKPGVYGRVIGRLTGTPIVVNTIHGLYATEGSPPLKRALVYGLEWIASRFSDAELVQSPEDFEMLTARRILPPSKTTLLGNGVDLGRFTPERAAVSRRSLRKEIGAGPEKVVVGMVGRLVAEKGVPELIAAAQRLGEEYLLVVAGPADPEKADAVPEEMIRVGEEAGMRFLGMRTDVESLYGAFDMFVLPSHREGFPRAAMEAAASGLPVIATDIRGCRQVVEPGVNGELVPVGDVDSLVAAIEKVGADEELRRAMGEASAVKAVADFDEKRVVDVVMATYARVAKLKGLEWAFSAVEGEPVIRRASRGDSSAVAQLHMHAIRSGFLSTLGAGFLTLLYRALAESADDALFVAEIEGNVVGFIAGTRDTAAFYKRFLIRHGVMAGIRLLGSLTRPSEMRRIIETLRYGSDEPRAAAELLSMAVAPAARRKGLGGKLVDRLLGWAEDRDIEAMTVVVATQNDNATSLYATSGFGDDRDVEVHRGEASKELLWRRAN